MESGKVLAHRQAAYDTGTRPTTVLLDLESGRELFRKAPANGTRWAAAFFDGTNVFLEATPANTGTADYEPERMTILDSRGEPAGTLPIRRQILSFASVRNCRRRAHCSIPFLIEKKSWHTSI